MYLISKLSADPNVGGCTNDRTDDTTSVSKILLRRDMMLARTLNTKAMPNSVSTSYCRRNNISCNVNDPNKTTRD